MIALVATLALVPSVAPIERDAYGVPHIYAPTWEEAFYHAGYAVAEDRLWQMEASRRIARGRMAVAFGASGLPSDRDVARFGYRDEDLKRQFAELSERTRAAFESYARGVNAYIAKAKEQNRLPPGYAESGLQPEPWDVLDSVAIAIRLFQLFGRRDPGEIRNWAFLLYLKAQPSAKDRALDVLDDFLWANDPTSPTTVRPEDDALASSPPRFARPTRAMTERHIESLPPLGLLDLLPALRIADNERQTRIAQEHGAPYKAGSYAIVVSKERSATATPLLLSAPQMGFTTPSVVHEMSIVAPGIAASGMDVPGVPGVLIGYTPHLAWALTSGVADTDDVYWFPAEGEGYRFGEEVRPFEIISSEVAVKGAAAERIEQKRTIWGPVVLTSKGTHLVRRSASWMAELRSMDALFGLYQAQRPSDLDQALQSATMNFNFHFAFHDGPIGYRFLGRIPQRPEGFDGRFPLPGRPEADWKGFVPPGQMPRIDDPRSGLIVNWNNKPASWWPNGDTPAWGRIFRVEALASALTRAKLTAFDLEMAAWTIARTDPNAAHFMPLVRDSLRAASLSTLEADAAAYLLAYDGRAVAGSPSATLFETVLDALREEVFLPTTGSILTPQVFRLAAQPSLILDALQRRTQIGYLGQRAAQDVVVAAFKKAVERLVQSRGTDPGGWGYAPGSLTFAGEPPISYSNRGTFIQVVELRATPRGRSVLPPGIAESGPHARDQVPLAREWGFKPMRMRPTGWGTPSVPAATGQLARLSRGCG